MATEYIKYFGMIETPFARNHDPKWLYLSTQHKEAVIKTRWTMQEFSGLALIRGDVGQGKSFLLEYLMTIWPHQYSWKCAKLQNTGTITSPRALIMGVCEAFGIATTGTAREMLSRLEAWLLAQAFDAHQTVVLFIDEAQSMDAKAFPILRDLLNLATRDRILLQIVMAAQLNIDKKLTHYPALQSRIASVATLEPLSREESDLMLLHRLKRAGCENPLAICPTDAMSAIHIHSGGVPRDILVVTEMSMKEAFLQDASKLTPAHVEKAFGDLTGRRPRHAKVA